MGKAPAFQLYAMDWMRDLDEHPLEIEGAWIRICCKMWFSQPRGEMTKSLPQWARILRVPQDEAQRILDYIRDENVGTVTVRDKKITVECRRMARNERERISNAARQKRHREKKALEDNAESNANITPPSSSSSSSSSSTSKKRTPPNPPSGGKSEGGKRFRKPTPEEVEEYAKSIDFVLDGEAFCDFYESKGWRVGSTPMKSWQAAVRTWKKRKASEPKEEKSVHQQLIDGTYNG